MPQDIWDEWLEEGDCAGDPDTGTGYSWLTRSGLATYIKPGDRFYIVAHGKLRGYAIVDRVERNFYDDIFYWEIIRGGGAVACTIASPIRGFQGLRKRWWPKYVETPFKDWKTP